MSLTLLTSMTRKMVVKKCTATGKELKPLQVALAGMVEALRGDITMPYFDDMVENFDFLVDDAGKVFIKAYRPRKGKVLKTTYPTPFNINPRLNILGATLSMILPRDVYQPINSQVGSIVKAMKKSLQGQQVKPKEKRIKIILLDGRNGPRCYGLYRETIGGYKRCMFDLNKLMDENRSVEVYDRCGQKSKPASFAKVCAREVRELERQHG